MEDISLREKIKGKQIKIVMLCITLFLCILYIAFIVFLSRCIGIDSDKAGHLLQAEDVLKGNFFLNNWYLTGVTFLTTDLVYYGIAYLFFGGTFKAAYAACGLMVASVVLVTLPACYKKENKIVRLIMFISFLTIPCKDYLYYARVHMGAVFCSFLVWYIAYILITHRGDNYSDNRIAYCIYFIIASLCGFSDVLTIIIGVMPVMVYCYFNMSYKDNRKVHKLLFVFSVLSILASVLIDKAYFLISSANKNDRLTQASFTSFEEIGDRISAFFYDLMRLTMADFYGYNILTISGMARFLCFIVLIISFFIQMMIMIRFIRREDVDVLSFFISFGIFITGILYILVNFHFSENIKYMTIIPVAAMALVIRNMDYIYKPSTDRRYISFLIICLTLVIFAGKIKAVKEYKNIWTPYNDEKSVVDFLREHNLTGGYAGLVVSNNL